MTNAPIIFVVRQRITHPRHLERFNQWHKDRTATLRAEVPQIAAVRRYHFDKDALFDTCCRASRNGPTLARLRQPSRRIALSSACPR